MAVNVAQLLERALAERRRGNWPAAQKLYEAAAAAAPGNAQIHHNLALCLYAQGRHDRAAEHAEIATRHAPQLVPAWVLRAKIERALERIEACEQSLEAALSLSAGDPQATLELADLTLSEFGDARKVQDLVRPLLGHPEYDEDAQLATLMAKLYDRDETAEELTKQIVAFSERYLTLKDFRFSAKRKPAAKRKRVGLLSPLFSVSPVYFFTYGSLSLLAEECDFVVFNRGTKSDWATDKFRGLAREWHDVAHLPAEALANAIYAENLDVLFDLGGWTDPIGLKALSTKPAATMYKWVGGQSCTTGLKVFDGFISDVHQTPPGTEMLYTEPLRVLECGYVTYTPPPYMPAGPAAAEPPAYGVISNPVKVSRAFLQTLAAVQAKGGSLRFIDRRYRHVKTRRRILAGLAIDHADFVAPASHREYLAQVAQLARVYDTAPYSGGLTTMEALTLGIPCATRAGRLFCERHTLSHFIFAGLAVDATTGQGNDGWITSIAQTPHAENNANRHAHDALATALLDLVHGAG